MGQVYARTMFTEASQKLQAEHGSRRAYEQMAARGEQDGTLGIYERGFIAERDSFYIASVTADGWPYMQHRGGPKGFLKVLDARRLAFADVSGNKQYITAGNVLGNDRVSLFLMDYPHQARLKVIGRMHAIENGAEYEAVSAGAEGRVERVFVIVVVGFDWNCPQHITQRFTVEEFTAAGWEKRPPAAL